MPVITITLLLPKKNMPQSSPLSILIVHNTYWLKSQQSDPSNGPPSIDISPHTSPCAPGETETSCAQRNRLKYKVFEVKINTISPNTPRTVSTCKRQSVTLNQLMVDLKQRGKASVLHEMGIVFSVEMLIYLARIIWIAH